MDDPPGAIAVQPHNDAEEPQTTSKLPHELTLPITRVKKIIKQDGEVKAISNDANYVIAKAAEMLLDKLVETSAQRTLHDDRILLAYTDVAATVHESSQFAFLDDVVPRKAQAAQLLRDLEQMHNGTES